ncbi:MAG: SPOR domain-containing protein [Microscillaceae bacterium]|nr:SPOR domain-containing protein [Microscillaceae bacterium]
MKLKCYFWLGVIGLMSMPALAQQKMDKEEERALKAELKDARRNLEKFNQMKNDDKELSDMIKTRQAQKNQLTYQANMLKQQLAERETALVKLNREASNPNPATGRKLTSGNDGKAHEVVFRVQVGAYRNPKLARMLNKNVNFSIEEGENGAKKYMVGNFNSYKEAKSFCEKLVNRGAQAYVVGYLDGQRVVNLKQMPSEYL